MVYTRTCICCGKQYEYCPHCGESKNKPRWLVNYDDEGCHVAFQTVTDYLAKEITKEEAKEKLESVDLKNRKMFKASVSKYVDEILDDVNTSDVAKVDDTKVDEVKVEDVKEKVKEEVKTEDKVVNTDEADDKTVEKKIENKFKKSYDGYKHYNK